MNHDRRTAWGFFALTLLTLPAFALGGGPSAYSPQMDAVPAFMVVITLYFFWRSSKTAGHGGRR